MKKYLLLLAFACSATLTMAQTIQAMPNPVTLFEPGYLGPDDRAGHATMENTATVEKTFTWTRNIICNEGEYSIQYCDDNGCYFPSVETGEITLPAGGTSTMDLHIISGGNGAAIVEITLEDVSDATNTVTVVYEYNSCAVSSEDIAAAAAISLFPNPASDQFALTENTVVENVVVYNILGSVVKRFTASSNGTYDIAELNAGIYMVQLLGEDDELLRTMKMNKQ